MNDSVVVMMETDGTDETAISADGQAPPLVSPETSGRNTMPIKGGVLLALRGRDDYNRSTESALSAHLVDDL